MLRPRIDSRSLTQIPLALGPHGARRSSAANNEVMEAVPQPKAGIAVPPISSCPSGTLNIGQHLQGRRTPAAFHDDSVAARGLSGVASDFGKRESVSASPHSVQVVRAANLV